MSVEEAGAAEGSGSTRHSYAQKVLHAFIVDGRLVSIPAKERKRQVILRYLATNDFVEDQEYPEREVNQRLALRHRDVAALRRSLVDSRYLVRQAGIYRRRAMTDWPVDQEDTSGPQDPRAASPEE